MIAGSISTTGTAWVATTPLKKAERPLYHYFDLKGLECGCVMWMDMKPEEVFVQDPSGQWFFEHWRREADGSHEFGYFTRVIRSLIRKGYIEEADVYDGEGRAIAVRRTDKVGEVF